MPPPDRFDVVLAGGGLANGLIAWRLSILRPELRLLLLEGGATLGGNHTWSFHDGDIDVRQTEWLEPFVVRRWPQHCVRFGGRQRRLGTAYSSITSTRFHALLAQRLGGAVRLGSPLKSLGPTRVECAGGGVIEAGAVIDGRGLRSTPHLALRYQRFLGLEVQLAAPHRLDAPILMDTGVAQDDGYRFMYVLPFSSDRLLIEDTCYADHAQLHASNLRESVLAYAAAQGWNVECIVREEQGVLPIALDGDIDAFWGETGAQPRSGLRAGLFHPTTGYSLPQAVRLADLIAGLADLSAPALAAAIEQHARAVWRSQAYFRALNRMLFLAGRPESRHLVFAHFYALPEALIGRFYAERLTWADRLRIVSGRPPVPIGSALKALRTLPCDRNALKGADG